MSEEILFEWVNSPRNGLKQFVRFLLIIMSLVLLLAGSMYCFMMLAVANTFAAWTVAGALFGALAVWAIIPDRQRDADRE
jgi:hypothetical protein